MQEKSRKSKARKATNPPTPKPQEPIDPVKVLEAIAANRRLAPSPRVAAARELLRYRLAMQQPQQPTKTADERQAEAREAKADRFTQDLNERALAILNTRGNA